MLHQLLSCLTEPSDDSGPTHESFSIRIAFLILGLSILIILGTLVPLFRIDFEVVLFLRSLQNPAVEEIGRIGNRLGHGTTLVLISVGLGIIGYGWKRDRMKRAGWQSLIAHGVAGLIIQVLKHLLGRPRPRFMHQDHWQMGPSLQGGLDTFPSGHSAASFAVAGVLARHFPRGIWIWYGAAGFVAVSRILRGSHFPSDALAGALIGYLVGFIFSRPLKDWFLSLLEALTTGLPYWVGGFGLIWITFHYPETGPLPAGMFWLGLILVVLSFGGRMLLLLRQAGTPLEHQIRYPLIHLIMGLGFALFTESGLVVLLALMTGLAWWVGHSQRAIKKKNGVRMDLLKDKTPTEEALMGTTMLALLFLIQQIKGLIPLQ